MKIIKYNFRKDLSKTKPFNFNTIDNLKDFNIATLYAEGDSPEYQEDIDKIFMVIEGNVHFQVKDIKKELNVGDMIHITSGEKFQISSVNGAQLIQLKQSLSKGEESIRRISMDRHSTRKFQDKPISKKDLYYVLKIGMNAPSGMNRQPWRFIVVGDPELKREIREKAEKVEKEYHENVRNIQLTSEMNDMGVNWKKPYLEIAPYLICIFGDLTQPYSKESLWISVGWMLLAAAEVGLGTLTYIPENMEFLNQMLNVDEKFTPEMIMPIGYAAREEPLQTRKDIQDVVSWV